MKAAFIIPIILMCRYGFSQTTVAPGNVNGTWTQAGSPYNVQGDLIIQNGDSLIIQPGVTVNFMGAFSLLVWGKLKAIGTQADTIRFIAPYNSAWNGINFNGTPVTNDSSKIIFCRLQNAQATGSSPGNMGGALYVAGFSKLRMSHCIIKNCSADGGGGGICLSSSNAIVSANTILFNTNTSTGEGGGGIYVSSGSPLISYNVISNNNAFFGGGIYVDSGLASILNNTLSANNAAEGGGISSGTGSATLVITGNKIQNNTAGDGGGILLWAGPDITGTISANAIVTNSAGTGGGISTGGKVLITNNWIIKNTGLAVGGGIECLSSGVTISYNFICNNTTTVSTDGSLGGGGIHFIDADSTTKVYNNVVANNSASFGGGIFCKNALPLFTNNTIVNNKVNARGGGLYCSSASNPSFINCILYGNTATTSGNQVTLYDNSCDPTFLYCDIEGGSAAFDANNLYNGTYSNNINSNPGFVSPSAGTGIGFDGLGANWQLTQGSPCVEAGNPAGSYPPFDLLNSPRLMGQRVDIGAYEYIFYVTTVRENAPTLYNITFFPNPVQKTLQLKSDVNLPGENTYVRFTDVQGKELKRMAVTGELSFFDISDLADGLYFVSITKNNRLVHQTKMVKQD